MIRRLLLILTLGLALAPALAQANPQAEKKKGGGASYIQITAIKAVVTRADGRRGVMAVEAGLNVPDFELRQRANQSIPRLRAAFVQVVQIYGNSLRPGGVPSTDYMAKEMQRQTDAVLGKPGAQFLLGGVLVN